MTTLSIAQDIELGCRSDVAVTETKSVDYSTVIADLKVAQAVTDTKIEELTREVREHNNFAQRIPVLEEKVHSLEKRL